MSRGGSATAARLLGAHQGRAPLARTMLRGALGIAAFAAVGLVGSQASAAQGDELWEGDWRQAGEPEVNPDELGFYPAHFGLELRFAPYWPEVDEELGSGDGPYAQLFGGKARVYFGVELDWLPLRIPYIGALGPAFGWGYTHMTGSALLVSTGEPANVDTALTIMPMHLSAVLRADYLLEKWHVPIVPYAKLGVGAGLWSTSSAGSTSEYDGVSGKGTSWGMHLALGGAVALTAFDQGSETAMHDDAGVQNVSLFGEWMWANLDGIGSYPAMHVGTSTIAFGLSIDW